MSWSLALEILSIVVVVVCFVGATYHILTMD